MKNSPPSSLVQGKQNAISWAILTATCLMLLKFTVSLLSGSLSLLASAFDSLMDLCISCANKVVVKKSEQPATKNFRYGFGRLEELLGFLEGLFVMGSGVFIAYKGGVALFFPHEFSYPQVVLSTMIVSLVATFFLVRFLKKQAQKTNSTLLAADAAHYQADLLANLAILLGVVIIWYTHVMVLDAIISVLIAGSIIWEGLKIVKKSLYVLLDREVELHTRDQILDIFDMFIQGKEINGFHEFRSRRSGSRVFIEAHLVFWGETSLQQAHNTAHKIEYTLQKIIPHIHAVFHLDPHDDSMEDARGSRQ